MKMNFQHFAFLLLALFVFPNFTNAQYLASDLLGQLDGSDNPVFTTNAINNNAGVVNEKGLSGPIGVTIDIIHHRLFVLDPDNRRVLVFNLDSNNTLIDRVADYVLGQPDFATNTAAVSPLQNNFQSIGPQCVTYDAIHDRLFVCDYGYHRMLVFNTTTISNGMNAAYVIGQPDFTTTGATTTQSSTRAPVGVAYDSNHNRLFVEEIGNNRVTVFDLNSIANGMNASYVLGQLDFVSTASIVAPNQNSLSAPRTGLLYDNENDRLFVSNSRRILVFGVAPADISNGMNASHVLGQTDFISTVATVTQSGLSQVRGLAYDPANKLLFVEDQTPFRILVFNVNPDVVVNGANAIAVLGQANFTNNASGVTQSALNVPYGDPVFDAGNNRLYFPDLSNNRILIYSFVKLSTTNPTNATQTIPYSQSLSTSNSQGTVSYAITTGSLPTGLSLNTTTGEISGTPTLVGSYDFTVQATDDNGDIGYFLSQPQEYTLTVEEPRSNSSGSRPRSRTTTYVPVVTEPSTPVYQVVELTTPSSNTLNFTRTLRIKDSGEDVKELQKYLNTHGYPVAIAGAGSLGNETTKFGLLTHSAVVKFQLANNLVGDGIVGPLTRAFLK
ncbi:MAG: peptidoglycan-binding protein [Candidatus Pacebacteria bacterium]|nr:peptidoglycan-binding protein [Candidatus Paceibacterota bacterium]